MKVLDISQAETNHPFNFFMIILIWFHGYFCTSLFVDTVDTVDYSVQCPALQYLDFFLPSFCLRSVLIGHQVSDEIGFCLLLQMAGVCQIELLSKPTPLEKSVTLYTALDLSSSER